MSVYKPVFVFGVKPRVGILRWCVPGAKRCVETMVCAGGDVGEEVSPGAPSGRGRPFGAGPVIV